MGGIDLEFAKRRLEELRAIKIDYFELCEMIHDRMDELPPKIQDDLWDYVYKRFEP